MQSNEIDKFSLVTDWNILKLNQDVWFTTIIYSFFLFSFVSLKTHFNNRFDPIIIVKSYKSVLVIWVHISF